MPFSSSSLFSSLPSCLPLPQHPPGGNAQNAEVGAGWQQATHDPSLAHIKPVPNGPGLESKVLSPPKQAGSHTAHPGAHDLPSKKAWHVLWTCGPVMPGKRSLTD